MKNLVAIVLLSLTLVGFAVFAEEGQSSGQPHPATHETVELKELLDTVARKSGKGFLVDRRVPAEVVVGTVGTRDIDYATLLTVLRNNGLAAAPTSRAVRIVPVSNIRQYELPLLRAEDDGIEDDEWVSRVVGLSRAHAPKLVPLLRPMVPKAGHLAASSDANVLVVVAPYGVTKRLVEIAEEIERRASAPQASTQ